MKKAIYTEKAPLPIGIYSQAIQAGKTLYLAGQIPLIPNSANLISGGIKEQTQQVFKNIQAICEEARCGFDDIVKLTIYLVDFNHFSVVNEVMESLFKKPYPARTTIQVSKLPKDALIEIDSIIVLG